ncbi:MAG TPA: nitroreductase family deazaflavin-dependent oxidoreductase [Jatrophihabitans sp.]|nr:nitroreductase family deazaflavin-dependent oxidoreductase [Jatrophihabitans sp.]
MTEVHDSPEGWVADHIKSYVSSDGEQGHLWHGVPTLLLTTKGRKSGELRRTALIYGEHDGAYLLVASQGGADKHPAWYLNLDADPEVQVQVGADKFSARARTASAEEKPELWAKMTKIWPPYDEYQAKTQRQIPVVVLERT